MSKCHAVYPDVSEIKYYICGYKFVLNMEHLKSVSKDIFGSDLFSGFDIREGLNRK